MDYGIRDTNLGNPMRIPNELKRFFLDEFFKKFPRLLTTNNCPGTPRGSILVDRLSPSKSPSTLLLEPVSPMVFSAWVDICNPLFPRDMVAIMGDLSYKLRVRSAVGHFLQQRVKLLGIQLADCLRPPNSGGNPTFAIPLRMEAEFISWFRNQVKTEFAGYTKASAPDLKILIAESNKKKDDTCLEAQRSRKRKGVLTIDSSDSEDEENPTTELLQSTVQLSTDIGNLLNSLCTMSPVAVDDPNSVSKEVAMDLDLSAQPIEAHDIPSSPLKNQGNSFFPCRKI